MPYASVNPFNGQSVKKFEELTDAQLEVKIAKAASCFEDWKIRSYAERAVIVSKAGELMRADVDRFAEHATVEMGKLLVKHAGCVPQCAIEFENLWTEAGAPQGLYTNLLISHDQSDKVLDDPRIKGVALTGCVAAARCIHGGHHSDRGEARQPGISR